jgi:hypothetical protein
VILAGVVQGFALGPEAHVSWMREAAGANRHDPCGARQAAKPAGPGRDEKGREVIGFAALKHDRQDENRFRDEIMLHDRDYGYGGYSI